MERIIYLTCFREDETENWEAQAILKPTGEFEGVAYHPFAESKYNMFISGTRDAVEGKVTVDRFCPEEMDCVESSFFYPDEQSKNLVGEAFVAGVGSPAMLSVNILKEDQELTSARIDELNLLIDNYKTTYSERFQPEVQGLRKIASPKKALEAEKSLRKKRTINYYL